MSAADGIAAPLRITAFRRIWAASLFSNLGTLIQGVGVAWAMTEMTSSADKVAQVQTALGLPVMLIAMLAGAIADVHDRRLVALSSLCIALCGAALLTLLALMGLLTPNLLLLLCFAVGCGMALMGPAWQSAVNEQVPPEAVPAAVALNGISFNMARSVGPAIGGLVLGLAGTMAVFALNALCYVPLIVALFLWKREAPRSRLPPEELRRAVLLGVRYIANSPPIMIVLLRSIVMALIGASILALMPLVARDLLDGGAGTFGLMFSAFGLGAVIGALNIAEVRSRMSGESAIRAAAMMIGLAFVVVAFSRGSIITAAALMVAGVGWTVSWTLFSIGVQLSAPRWVSGRALAAYQAAAAGGTAIGAWGWGHLANSAGVEVALFVSGLLMMASTLIGIWLRMPRVTTPREQDHVLEDPTVQLPLSGHSGPLVIEIEYRIAPYNARAFHDVMQEVQQTRQRNGAFGWSLARDIADPDLWTERYHFPTWHDYLRYRNRPTASERLLEQKAIDFHLGEGKLHVRRRLQRPFD